MLAHDVAGNGPPILFLHEGIADRRMWEPQVGPFTAAGYSVIRCDLRGFGDSEPSPGPFSSIDDVEELRAGLGLDRMCIVGASLGGRVALEYTLTFPERVSSLVLVGPGMRGMPPTPELEQAWEEEEALIEAGDLDGAVEVNLRAWVDGPSRGPGEVDPDVRAQVGEMQRRAIDLYLAAPDSGPEAPFDPPASTRLAEVACPTLLLVGDLDQPTILAVADQLSAGIPGVRREVMHGTAHVPSMEKPDEFNRLVLGFLETA